MPRVLQPAVALYLAMLLSACAAAAEARALSDRQWIDDLQQLATSVKEIHFKPFHVVSEADFDSSVAELQSQIPGLTDKEIIVGMAKIVAMPGDGHTRLHIPRLYPQLALIAELGHSGTAAPKVDALRFMQSPVQLALFSDGLFVVAARPEYRRLISQRVLYIDETPIAEAIRRVRSVSFFENDSRAGLMAPDRLSLPGLNLALGISKSDQQFTLTTLDNEGTESKTRLISLSEAGKKFVSGAPENPPLWRSRSDEFRWYRILPERDAIFLQVNRFEEEPVAPYGDFVAEALATAKQAGVSRFVIDLRHNSGGIGAWVTPFVTGLSRSEFNEYGRLYILMGSTTFSAAQFFIHKFEEYTYAIFAGSQSGARPSHFSDPKRVVLDNSGLTLRVSTIYWHSWLANDFRDAINPHIPVPLTAEDFFNGSDPVLDAVLEYQAPDGLAMQIDEQFRQGNNQNALLLYGRYMSDGTIGNHREVIPDLLEMADKLVSDGLTRPGYFIYLLADRSYPGDPKIRSGLERIEKLMQ
ncbi:MAG: hypothetical protein HKM98_03605 [Gammaproteobacteria bacterium]|nr:hypothetical protein [Gammaproteobacteria bacterium]